MKKILIGALFASAAIATPFVAMAAKESTLKASGHSPVIVSVSPLTVAPGGTLTLNVDPNGSYVRTFYWITKGASETAIYTGGFGCYQWCTQAMTRTLTIPSTWANGTDYYFKVYDGKNDVYIKTPFAVHN